MEIFRRPVRALILALLVPLLACSAPDSASPGPASPFPETSPTPPASSPASPTSPALPLLTPAPLALQPTIVLPTPTPFAYAVKSGDTLSQIALRHGLTVDELLAANPGVSTILSIGQVIQIPSRPASVAEAVPAPAELLLGLLQCFPSGAGMWCLALAQNPHPEPVENITAQISILNQNGEPESGLEALAPLNILPAGAGLPVAAFFPSRPPGPFAARLDILTAFLLSPGDPRYLLVQVNNLLAQVSADGLSAQVSGRLVYPQPGLPAAEIWLAGVAYDEAGQVAGFRRWQAAGAPQTFSFDIYSLGLPIARVEVIAEARP